jgi:hypothetical protein
MSQSETSPLQRADAVISRFRDLREMSSALFLDHAVKTIQRISIQQKVSRERLISSSSELIPKWQKFHADQILRNQNAGHLFNPLHFFPIGEIKHSELLGYLLKPNAGHGQGCRLLNSFLERLGVPSPGEGQWIATIETGRIDIMLRRSNPRSIIVIENKSHSAVDQQHQLYRYWHHHIYCRYPELNYSDPGTHRAFQIIYLPGSPGKVPESHSTLRPLYLSQNPHAALPITPKLLSFRKEIADWLEETAKEVPDQNLRLRTYLEFYRELCQTL